jgi:hypothetical protein
MRNDDGTRGSLTRIGNLSDERRSEVVEEYDEHDHAATVGELLSHLVNEGLITEAATGKFAEALSYFDMTPDTNITWAGTEVNSELCPECGQPDNCGDCDHTPIT